MIFRAALIETETGLAGLEPEWWALWGRIPTATPFQSPAWLLPWWRHFAPGALCVIAVRVQDRLVGLAPLYREHGPDGSRLLPVGIAISDYLDALIEPSMSAPVGRALMGQAGAISWSRWDMEELAPEAQALGLPCPDDASETMAAQSACPVIPLDPGRGMTASVPARRRRQLRRALAAAERRGPFRIEALNHDPDEFLGHLLRLHAARWAEQDEPGVLADATVQGFHRAALPALVRAGLARLSVVRIGTAVVGAYYGLLSAGRAYAYLGGFDPDYAPESPGSILLGDAIDAALGEGATEFHFLRGQEAYKYAWGAVDRWNMRRCFTRGAAP